MAEKNTPSSNSSLFILIIPLALISIVLIKTWKVILSIIFLGVGWRIWQQYEWQQIKQQIDPYFKDLIQDKRGNLTVLDLAQTAQIPNNLASKYLLSKARQYGAQLLSYGDDRDTYYFLTAGVIQGILTDSEPEIAPDKFVPPSLESVDNKLVDPSNHQLIPTNPLIEEPETKELETVPQTAEAGVIPEKTIPERESIARQSIDYFPDAKT